MSISPDEYKFIADSLGETDSLSLDIAQNVGFMYTTLVNNETDNRNTAKQILQRAIGDTYVMLLIEHVDNSPQLNQIVTALQDHVVFRYGTVDAFLEAFNIKVSQSFANLSEQLGFEIDSTNIE